METLRQKKAIYRQDNAEDISIKNAIYKRENSEDISIKNAIYKRENAEVISIKNAIYKRENAEDISIKNAIYKRENAEVISINKSIYRQQNKHDINKYMKEYMNRRTSNKLKNKIYNGKKKRTSKHQQTCYSPNPSTSIYNTFSHSINNTNHRNTSFQLDNNDNSNTYHLDDISEHVKPENLKEFIKEVKESYNQSNRIFNKDTKQMDDNLRRGNICIVCDCHIIGTEEIKWVSKQELEESGDRLSVASYQEYYSTYLNRDLVEQYQVVDPDLHGLLLSPRAYKRHYSDEYHCCVSCYNSIVRGNKEERSSPPKFAIANGFAIGYIPREIKRRCPVLNRTHREIIPEKDLDDVICAAISTRRPFGYVFSYIGGAQKSIKGHFSIFAVDQSHVGGVLKKYRNIGNTHKNIFVVLCGRMTPQQKGIVRRQAEMDTDLFLDLLTWFATESGHPAYKDVVPPEEYPDPVVIIQDEDKQNNTDESQDPRVECRIEGKTYYFSNVDQNPNGGNSVFDNNNQFLNAMLDNNAPVLLMYGGNYLKSHEIHLEDMFPIQFPFGTGGPDLGIPRKVPVSIEECLRHYCRLSLKQFMRPDFILVCYHILCRNASFKTGLIKCKSDFQGNSLTEKLSQMSVHDLKEASTMLSNNQQDNESDGGEQSFAGSFLKSITTMCKVLGHTKEAAQEARKKVYAMTDRFGPHSIFFTITPDDECTFRVRVFAAEGDEIKIPKSDCSESDCILDFKVRAEQRVKYPGACSIFYQSVMQQVYKLLGWDPVRKRATGKGIFGEPEAIFHADEEQSRNTLHAHFLIWIKNFSKVREALFHEDERICEEARDIMKKYVDSVFCSDYDYSSSLPVIHEECESCFPVNDLFEETDDLQELRDARNKHFCLDIEGKILKCKCCGSKVSSSDLFNATLKAYKKRSDEQHNLSDHGEDTIQDEQDETIFPPTRYRQDIMTYRYPIDNLSPDADEFYYNSHVRFHIATFRMNEHDWKHRPGCHKHGCECRFFFPKKSFSQSTFVEDDVDEKTTTWRYIDENTNSKEVYPYTFESKRSVGSQYLNTHSKTITEVFGCNSNIQMGSPRCVFYVVHYSTKSTQKEDRGADYDRISNQVMHRMRREKLRIEKEIASQTQIENNNNPNNNNPNDNNHNHNNPNDNNERDDDDRNPQPQELDENYWFREALIRFLIGMSTHVSQDVISSTMAHLMISQKGSRFTFSHDFRNLLAGQMLNHLLGRDPGDFVLRRRNKGNEGELYMWPDYSINDYLFRPNSLEEMSFYQFSTIFEKIPFTFDRLKQLNEDGLPILKEGEMYFEEGHPGRRYCYLKQCSREHIPIVSMPNQAICDLECLELDSGSDVNDSVAVLREEYAQIALILFCPFRGSELFELPLGVNNLWDKMHQLMTSAGENNSNFWIHGKRILQNMQDTHQSRKCRLPADPLESSTILKQNSVLKNEHFNDGDDGDNVFDNALDPSEFFFGELSNHNADVYQDQSTIRHLNDFKRGLNFFDDRIFASRVYPQSLFDYSSNIRECENIMADSSTRDEISEASDVADDTGASKYQTLLGFVSGAVVGRFSEIDGGSDDHMQDGYDIHITDDRDEFLLETDWNSLGFSSQYDRRQNIPTMSGIARKIAHEKGIYLDRLQYIAYEIICTSFMLSMVNEGWEEDTTSIMGFTTTTDEDGMNSETENIKNRIIENLKKIGAKDQLIMFITGPAGAGKSTAITVAQRFCFEFCKSLGIAWKDNTFLFTAMTGCAASLFGGMTIHSAAHLCKRRNKFTDKLAGPWKDVKVLILDEISMATDGVINRLNENMNFFRKATMSNRRHIKPNMVFGGYHVIFSGDFRQIPPVGASDYELLYKKPGLWENAINVAIMLTNSHRFKDDPEYGEILMRMWKGTFTRSDCDRINERMMSEKLSLPDISVDSDIAYACSYNSERVALQAALFQKHIENFPSIDSNEMPPEHTVIVEAKITDPPKRKPKKSDSNNSEGNTIIYAEVTDGLRNVIYSRMGDCHLKDEQKMIDPALKLYVGCHCMINDNDDIKEGRANGTVCRVVSIKRKNTTPLQWKNYDGKKVYTMNVRDIEYIEFEHFPKSKEQVKLEKEIEIIKEYEMNEDGKPNHELEVKEIQLAKILKRRRFKLRTKKFYCIFYEGDAQKKDPLSPKIPKRLQRRFKCTLEQFPINLNDATTGHKLQGMSKDQLVVQSWTYKTSGWPYTVLSRVRKFLGLFLNEKLDFSKYSRSYLTTERDLKAFDDRMYLKIPENARLVYKELSEL